MNKKKDPELDGKFLNALRKMDIIISFPSLIFILMIKFASKGTEMRERERHKKEEEEDGN